MIELVAFLLKIGGVAFLGVATIGLIRLDDPFQRMHAATKAGTLGAGLVLIGTMIAKGNADAAMTGTFALLFLILTIPVASHLLARAAYISGAELSGIGNSDALQGRIDRLASPLEERLDTFAFQAPAEVKGVRPSAQLPGIGEPAAEVLDPEGAPLKPADMPVRAERVRFAAFGAGAPAFAERVAKLAVRLELPLTAVIAIDTRLAESTCDTSGALRSYRNAIGAWLPEMRALADKLPVPFDLLYEEGDAEDLLCGTADSRELLVLPIDGWVDHGVTLRTPCSTWDPDGLLRLADRHPGPVLYAGATKPEGAGAVLHDGSDDVRYALSFALENRLWLLDELRVVGQLDAVSRLEIEGMAAAADTPVRFIDRPVERKAHPVFEPGEMTDVTAVILPDLPGPRRTNWFGDFWQDRVARGWRGDVLVWT